MSKRKEILAQHPYRIFQDKQGKWYTRLRIGDKTVLKKRSTRSDLEDLIVAHIQDQLDNPTLQEIFTEWNERRRDMGKITPSSHMRYQKIFERHFDTLMHRKIRSFKSGEIVDFLEEQIPRFQLSAKAFSNLKTITKGMLKRAKRRGYIDWNIEQIFSDIDVSDKEFKHKPKGDTDEVYTDEERVKVITYLYNHLDNQLNVGILMLFATGMRVGELMALKPCDILDDNTIRVQRTESCYLSEDGKYIRDVKDYPKTEAGIRTIVVPECYASIIHKARLLNPFGEYVFEKHGKRMTIRALEARLQYVCKDVGIPYKSPHKIRKTYGSILLDNHVDARMILDQMGHTDLSTTERFYHRNRKDVDTKINILNTLPEFSSAM